MNSARTLADRFRTQRTDRIRVDGIEVLSIVELQIEPGDAVEVMIESSRSDIEQSLHIRTKRTGLEVVDHSVLEDEDYDFDPSIISTNLTVVANQSRRVEFVLSASAENKTRLKIWNSWLLGDAEHAWTGNSGIVSEKLEPPEHASSRMRLWCSDGLGDPQFDDLVALITVGERAPLEV